MITAHLPSGYIAYRALKPPDPLVLWACLIGAVFPDFDLLWFFLIDNQSIHHHRYWVHAPGFWLAVSLLVAPVLWQVGGRIRFAGFAFLGAWFLHLCLDSIAGSIMWLWPFSDQFYQLTTVQPTHSHYLLSFLAHWSFTVEILIWLFALMLLFKKS
ncbi:MAG: metal-dependent hydrolase [Pseudomonadota bacterium]